MKLLTAALVTETNSFSPIPTGRAAFEENRVFRGDATAVPELYWTAPLHRWRACAESEGWQVVESLAAFAQPAGPTAGPVFETFRKAILSDLAACGGADVILLALHGAMMADTEDDCEGALLADPRRAAPDAVIGGLLDPHSHLTSGMLAAADLLVAFLEYPHVDVPQRAVHLFDLAARTARGAIRPVMRAHPCNMLVAMPTTSQPMRARVDAMAARTAEPDLVSVSLIHGFPWGDHPEAGTQTLVISDGDAPLAERVAAEEAAALWSIREALNPPLPDIGAALDAALAAGGTGPVVLADQADNPGGGAPGDATFLLRAILSRRLCGVVTGIYWDPVVVRLCAEAGEGTRLPLRLGGKLGPVSGDPLDIEAEVVAIRDGLTQRFGQLPVPLGRLVHLRTGGVDIVVSDLRGQVFHPEAFTQMGIELANARIVCVKSSTHFHAGFAPIAAQVILVATPGAISPDFAAIPARRQPPGLWPRAALPRRTQGATP
ncbi:MAG: M81 family metallopeptidase [Rhodobacteraceae bacterium]|nr:M81 family metallopeptidase [Paracoccaceae bacterium]